MMLANSNRSLNGIYQRLFGNKDAIYIAVSVRASNCDVHYTFTTSWASHFSPQKMNEFLAICWAVFSLWIWHVVILATKIKHSNHLFIYYYLTECFI